MFFFHCLMVHGPGSGRKDGWIFTGRCGSGSEYSKANPLWTMLIALIKKKSGEVNKIYTDTKTGGFKYVLFSSLLGEMIDPIWLIFFKWVGSTTN